MQSKQDWYSKWLDGDFGTMESFINEIQIDSYNQAKSDAQSVDEITKNSDYLGAKRIKRAIQMLNLRSNIGDNIYENT